MGGAATAAALLACCSGPAFGPLIVSLLGASGAVALERLRPCAWPLLIVSGIAIGVSLTSSIRRMRSCASGRAALGLACLSLAVWLVAFALVV